MRNSEMAEFWDWRALYQVPLVTEKLKPRKWKVICRSACIPFTCVC
jgi:hypothetical protein